MAGGVTLKKQVKYISVILLLLMNVGLVACGSSPQANTKNGMGTTAKQNAAAVQPVKSEQATGIKIKVTAGKQVLTATLIDNATTRSLIGKFPLTVPMKNLYSREMVYRFSVSLPAEQAQRSGYEVGDLSYWTPGHSLVIFYAQNGEVIDSLQKIGRFDADLSFFKSIEAADVRFELLKE